jgi:hypothetical protein
MRIPRLRFTVRRLMLAVAVVAALLGCADLWRRREHYRRLAETHALSEMVLRVDSVMARGDPTGGPGVRLLDLSDSLEEAAKWADYHAGLRRKYERAARYPWLPVAPDPPPP